MRNGQPDTPDFWTYKAASATPDVQEAIACGAIAAGTTADRWEAFSPGMRREIVRSARKANPWCATG